MRASLITLLAASLAVGACAKADKQQPQEAAQTNADVNAQATAADGDSSGELAAAPKAPSLPEPKGPIDPKSVEAAAQVVQHYGALIERGRWLKAERLWGDVNAARDEATSLKENYSEYHVEIGNPGRPEGAAGSVYVSIPGAYYGKFKNGKPFRHKINFVMRRVNDVPGSTDAERRWHIERIEDAEEF